MEAKGYDIVGNIVIIKFPDKMKVADKKKFGNKFLSENSSIKTVLEKVGKFSGRLRTMETKYICGEKNKEVLYKENGCVFRFNVDTTYFSPRLSNERKEVASKIKKKDKVFVMFAGVAPFSICIARNSEAQVYSNEINREANKYGRLNAELNKVKDKVVFVDGDARRVAGKLKEKFDVIVMPRPQLKDSFLDCAFKVSKKGTRVFYYDFCGHEEFDSIKEKVKAEAKKAKKKIKILKVKKAGEVAPYRFRVRVDFMVV